LLFCILSLSACFLHVYDLLPVVIVLCTRTPIYIYIFGIACIILSFFYLVKDNELMHENKFFLFISMNIFCYFIHYLLYI
jgi:hypothetical protein